MVLKIGVSFKKKKNVHPISLKVNQTNFNRAKMFRVTISMYMLQFKHKMSVRKPRRSKLVLIGHDWKT